MQRATEATLAPETCCVCGAGSVVYRNYHEQPFCLHCANCQCGEIPCVRTGVNDPVVAGPMIVRQVVRRNGGYFTSPQARAAYLRRVARRTGEGRR